MKLMWILLLRLLLVILPGLLLAFSILLFYYNYEDFTYTIFERFGQLDKLEKFRTILLTRDRFLLLRVLAVGITGAGFVFAIIVWQRMPVIAVWWKRMIVYFNTLFYRILRFWQAIPASEKIAFGLLLFGVIVSRLYFLFRFPFHIDERFSYLYFVSKGLGVSLAYYPNPNNHILYTLFCYLTSFILHEPVLIMKVPSLLFGICLTVLFWGVVRYYLNAQTAILSSTLFSFSEYIFYYGMQGRGYTLLLIFTLLALVSVLKIINDQQVRLPVYVWFCLSAVLGFYTIPIFLYPFCGMFACAGIYLIRQKAVQKLQWMAISLSLIILSTFVLYLPVLLFNGITAISGNSWVAPLLWQHFIAAYPANLLDLNANLWGIIPYGQWLTFIVVISCSLMLINKNEMKVVRQWSLLFLVCLLVTIIISILQRILLYQRVLIYLSIFQYLLLSILISKVICLIFKHAQSRLLLIYSICVLVAGGNVYAFYKYTSTEKFDLYDSFDATAAILYNRNADNIFVNYYEYSLCIRFKYETSGKALNMDTNEPVPGAAYQFLVIHHSRPFPDQLSGWPYRVLYKDAEVTLYERQ